MMVGGSVRAICILGLLVALRVHADCPAPLRIGMVDFDVGVLVHGSPNEEPRGLLREDAEKVLAGLGCRAEWSRQPVRRLGIGLANGGLDIVVGVPHFPAASADAVYPRTPDGQLDGRRALAISRISLYVLAGATPRVTWNGRFLSSTDVTVGVVTGSAQMDMVRGRGWRLDEAPSFASNLSKLRQRRIDVAVLPALGLSEAERRGPPALVELAPPLEELALYAPVSPQFMASQPKLARQIWLGLCRRSRERDPEHRLLPCPNE